MVFSLIGHLTDVCGSLIVNHDEETKMNTGLKPQRQAGEQMGETPPPPTLVAVYSVVLQSNWHIVVQNCTLQTDNAHTRRT